MIPQPIYEALPYLYGTGGVFAIVGLETVGGKFCGFLLITAGIIIHQARSRHRGKKAIPTKNSGCNVTSRRSLPDRPSTRRS
jgi:hypothetical protein